MKKILIQLDSDKYASAFDSIVAYDSGIDAVLPYGGITTADVRSLVLGAFFTRGIPDLNSLAVWIGGSNVALGEQLLAEARRTFFGPFKVSVMLDSNGCNTTASAAVAKLAGQTEIKGKKALVLGSGPVGLRAAMLLAKEGGLVTLASIPPELFAGRFDPELSSRTIQNAMEAAATLSTNNATGLLGSLDVVSMESTAMLAERMAQADIVAAAGPAGMRLAPQMVWESLPELRWIIDFNLTEPLGVEGIKPGDDFADYKGRKILGALAIGNLKMKVHKACLARLFDRNDLLLDVWGVYPIAKELT